MTSRATVYALAVALATLFLAPSWQDNDAWSAAAVRSSQARDAVPTAVAEVDPVSDHRGACSDPCTGEAALDALRPDLVVVGRVPADTESASWFGADVRTCDLRGPPPA